MGFKSFISNAWNGIKSGVGTAGQYLSNGYETAKTGVGKAGQYLNDKYNDAKTAASDAANWAWKNKGKIADSLAAGLSASGNPLLMGVGGALKAGVNAYRAFNNVPNGEARDALMKSINQEPGVAGYNQNVSYSNMPRIYYSAQPKPRPPAYRRSRVRG